MTNVVNFPAPYSPAVQIARWASDAIAMLNDSKASVHRARLKQEIDSEVSFVRRRWSSSEILIFEFLNSCNSTSAVRLSDILADAAEVLFEDHWDGEKSLSKARRKAEEHLSAVARILETATSRALELVNEGGKCNAFVSAFESYRRSLEDLSIPRLSKWQRRRVFREMNSIDDLHNSILSHL